jgi:hypothetical protein
MNSNSSLIVCCMDGSVEQHHAGRSLVAVPLHTMAPFGWLRSPHATTFYVDS